MRWLAKKDKENGEYAFRLGVLLGKQKRYDEAEPYLERAFTLMPENADALRGLIDCMVQLRRNPKLIISLTQDLTELEPTAMSFDLLSRIYYITGQLDESIEAMRKAMNLEPQNPVYKKRYQALLARQKQ